MTDLEHEVRTVIAQVEAGDMEPRDAIVHLAYWIGFGDD